jgi:hypothetical protein
MISLAAEYNRRDKQLRRIDPSCRLQVLNSPILEMHAPNESNHGTIMSCAALSVKKNLPIYMPVYSSLCKEFCAAATAT